MDNYKLSKLLIFAVLAIFNHTCVADIDGNKPPFMLSIEQAFNWQPDNDLANKNNISQVPLAKRFIHRASQLSPNRDIYSKVLLAPDGMNNYANYTSTQSQFNLYNFTHWSYIDILNWFGGTAEQTINIPSRPWVEVSHKNGVKVIGTVFLAVAQYGGSAEAAKRFLRRDSQGNFPMADKLIEIAEFYQFDGWLMNQETDLSVVKDEQGKIIKGKKNQALAKHLASEMQEFMVYLTGLAPKGMEIHWYDSMLSSGVVHWQNELNSKNLPFIQASKTSRPSAHGIFLNYWWNAQMVENSASLIKQVGRSPYDLYFGTDLWPQRNAQKAFTETDWLTAIFPKEGQPGLTSIALFANNFNYNFDGDKQIPAFSTFRKDKNDVRTFYDTETRLFAGDDLNLSSTKTEGWVGLGRHIAARSSIQSLPFTTYFNTGHGMKLWSGGKIKHVNEWHNISHQDHLPTWQFAVQGSPEVKLNFNFTDAYEGGSSLLINSQKRTRKSIIPLYKTRLKLKAKSHLSVIYKVEKLSDKISLVLDFDDAPSLHIPFESTARSWKKQKIALGDNKNQIVNRISLHLAASQKPFSINLGGITID